MKAPHLCQLEVRGYELDSFGHVNNSVYLNYLEFARWKMLNEHGITLARIQEWKRWPVISRVEISYLKPLFMGDLIEIRTTIPELRRASFAIDQKIYKANVLVTDARLTSVIVDERGVPASLPEAFRKLGAHSATGDQS